MSKRCPECHRVNEDVHSFCVYCGATLDPHLRLIQGLEKQKEELAKGAPSNTRQRGDVNFYTPRRAPQKKKSSSAPWVVLGLIAAAVILWLLLK